MIVDRGSRWVVGKSDQFRDKSENRGLMMGYGAYLAARDLVDGVAGSGRTR
jgi:hypothetical protein